jgi:hypothetical protein
VNPKGVSKNLELALHFRRIVLPLFYAGLLIYVLGFWAGFFWLFLVYLLTPIPPILNFYYFVPVYVFEMYPRFVLVFSTVQPLILFFGKFSIFSIVFFVSAISAIVSVYLRRFSVALFFSVLASLAVILQYGFLGGVIGFETAGFKISILEGMFTIHSFYIIFSYRNLYPIALAAILFVIGMNILFAILFQEKTEQISATSTVNEKFKVLKSIHRTATVSVMMMYTIIAALNLFYLTPFEFPYVYRMLGGYTILLYGLFIYLLLVAIPCFLDWVTYKRCRQIVADAILPILGREFVNRKPLIQIFGFKTELGLEFADRRQFREVLVTASKNAENRDAIRFRVLGNYIYLEEPLVALVEEKIRQNGQANIIEIAKEIQADPMTLRRILINLKKRNLLENVRILGKRIIPTLED